MQLSRFYCYKPVSSKFTKPKLLDCCVVGAVLEAYQNHHPKPKTIAELKETVQMIWDSLLPGPIDKAIREFPKRPMACVLHIYSDYRILIFSCYHLNDVILLCLREHV